MGCGRLRRQLSQAVEAWPSRSDRLVLNSRMSMRKRRRAQPTTVLIASAQYAIWGRLRQPLECAPRTGQIFQVSIDRQGGPSEGEGPCPDTAATAWSSSARSWRNTRRRNASWAFQRHDLSRNLIRIWIEKAEAGSLDQDMASAELLTEYETRIAALERLVGRQALEIEYLKGAQKNARSPRSGPTSVITGPVASPSNGGAR